MAPRHPHTGANESNHLCLTEMIHEPDMIHTAVRNSFAEGNIDTPRPNTNTNAYVWPESTGSETKDLADSSTGQSSILHIRNIHIHNDHFEENRLHRHASSSGSHSHYRYDSSMNEDGRGTDNVPDSPRSIVSGVVVSRSATTSEDVSRHDFLYEDDEAMDVEDGSDREQWADFEDYIDDQDDSEHSEDVFNDDRSLESSGDRKQKEVTERQTELRKNIQQIQSDSSLTGQEKAKRIQVRLLNSSRN